MPPTKQSKETREKWIESYSIDLALRPTEFAENGTVKAAACKFCETFGHEDSMVRDQSALPLSTEEEASVRKGRKTTKTKYWTKFRTDIIQTHHREQHAKKWAEYLLLLDKKHDELEPLKQFFKQPNMEAFFEKRVSIEGSHRTVSMSLSNQSNIDDNPKGDFVYSYTPNALVASYEQLKKDGWNTQLPAINSTFKEGSDIIVAAIQITGSQLSFSDVMGFCARAEEGIIEAATQHHAQLIVLPELWCGPYFCQTIHNDLFQLSDPCSEENILIQRMQYLAILYHVVLPISIYERENNVYYNSLVMIESDGSILGKYRKSHIPDAIGYYEKFYFTPGDTGFSVFTTSLGKVGIGICWDQWFPEVARSLVLQGAELLIYPTAIGNEPEMPNWDTSDHWQRVMQGHSAANFVPVVACNRYGTEIVCSEDGATEQQRMTFYGKSFITDYTGAKVAEVKEPTNHKYEIITATIDIQYNQKQRTIFGCFRDRRPDLYGTLLTKDGSKATL